ESGHELVGDRFVPIGRPLANTEIYLLDSHLEPAPTGIPGELCIGGAALALRHLNRPELTAGRFGETGLRRPPRRGDLARWLPDGNIEFLGRADRQLKIRGFRIEPGEIEAAIERHPSVRRAAVTVWEPKEGDRRLAAFVEPSETGVLPDWQTLREHL